MIDCGEILNNAEGVRLEQIGESMSAQALTGRQRVRLGRRK